MNDEPSLSPRVDHPGNGLWILLVAWSGLMLVLGVLTSISASNCRDRGGLICFDFTGAVALVWALVGLPILIGGIIVSSRSNPGRVQVRVLPDRTLIEAAVPYPAGTTTWVTPTRAEQLIADGTVEPVDE